MIKIFDYENYNIYEGSSEGSGRSEKIWLTNPKDGSIGLFKFPKSSFTTEYISESMAYYIAKRMKLDNVKYDIGYRDGKIGCFSKSFLNPNDYLIHGVDFITQAYPNFNTDTLYDNEKEFYYSIEMIFESFEMSLKSNKNAIHYLKTKTLLMMLFDMLIGNSDRHQNNWGIIVNAVDLSARFAPLYDNGSSICAYISENDVDSYLGKDRVRFEALVDSKSKSRIRINGKVRKEPSHRDVITHLKKTYSAAMDAYLLFKSRLSSEWLHGLVNKYPEELLSKNKKELIYRFLVRKLEIIKEIMEGSE